MAILIFSIFVILTLGLTWVASKRIANKSDFLTASSGIPAWQNGVAIAGDFMSAATFLGITGLMFRIGYDAYILSFAILVGWPLMLFLIAEPFRNLGRYTVVDVISFRMNSPGVRLLSAATSLAVIMFYLIGQMVGAGKLIELLFGVPYWLAVLIVAGLIMIYVNFGGMIATTWVQMIKAVLLMAGGVFLSVALLALFEFDLSQMLERSAAAHPMGTRILEPGGWLRRDPVEVATVGLTMCFGIMGLPHILMRFFTVKNAASARNSVALATALMAVFYALVLVIGYGSIAAIWNAAEFRDAAGNLVGGENMVALHASKAVGGELALGFMSAVTFATILAVVAGLVLAGAATIAHDIWPALRRRAGARPEDELRVTRAATALIAAGALLLGLLFEKQNIAIVVALALAIAASVNFPILLLSIYWKDMTSTGATLGGALGLTVCGVLIALSESVWVALLGNEAAVFPYVYPTVVAMPVTFIAIIAFSLLDRSERAINERSKFQAQFIRSQLGQDSANVKSF